ncbi:hypothetical protein [Sinorhizobium americanum]|uniref:Uncharacterized protein n=1 Tax=Sinorhizobium americanum TaxID=194963 RepID=A0A1L3LSL8_9HYPH|nr:hypothetical protein [Sinorhizobium americanum]APG93088.1 hypothetical protein SAMCFNEI73_pA0111 [Sinorhizobium americanum]OAP35920.1 hypothetical protein ATC00_22350 [Sinorhizobium americanum]
MTEDFGMEAAVSLEAMMERHIAALSATSDAVREWDERRAAGGVSNVVYANALLEVTKGEEAARLRIVEHQPRDDRESKLKLTYMAAYLFATRGALKDEEMAAVMLVVDL